MTEKPHRTLYEELERSHQEFQRALILSPEILKSDKTPSIGPALIFQEMWARKAEIK